jgi:hypothetical protein
MLCVLNALGSIRSTEKENQKKCSPLFKKCKISTTENGLVVVL